MQIERRIRKDKYLRFSLGVPLDGTVGQQNGTVIRDSPSCFVAGLSLKERYLAEIHRMEKENASKNPERSFSDVAQQCAK